MRVIVRVIFASMALQILALPARAQSTATLSDDTKRFIAVALASSSFVDEAGNTAIANGGSAALQRFARGAIADQRAMKRRLAAWSFDLTQTPAEPVVYQRMWDYGPIGLAFFPLNAAVAATSFVLYRALGTTSGGVVLQSDAKEQLERLQDLSGAEFNAAYRASQDRAYNALIEAYEGYARTGDDLTIRRLAAAEIPVLKRQLKALPR